MTADLVELRAVSHRLRISLSYARTLERRGFEMSFCDLITPKGKELRSQVVSGVWLGKGSSLGLEAASLGRGALAEPDPARDPPRGRRFPEDGGDDGPSPMCFACG